MPRHRVAQVIVMAGVLAGLGYLVLWSADGWADWVVFAVVVVTAYGAAIAVNPRLYARRKRTISRSSS